LVFLPTDPATGEVFGGSIRALVSAHGTVINFDDAPTESWPSNMTELLTTATPIEVLSETLDYLFATVGAASGAIVVNPDYIGYGESVDYDRTYLAGQTYAQSFAMSWLATQKYVANSTAGCSELENVATVAGYSEGGYAVLPGSVALQQLGVTIYGAYPGAAPLQPIEQFASVLSDFATGNLTAGQVGTFKVLTAYSGYAYSNEFPFLANTGVDQRFLADSFLIPGTPENAIDWFAAGATIGLGFVVFVPDIATDIINPDLAAIFDAARADGVTDPCTDYFTNTTDKLCQMLEESSLIPLLGAFEGGRVVVDLWAFC
jgi:hypothetical protein